MSVKNLKVAVILYFSQHISKDFIFKFQFKLGYANNILATTVSSFISFQRRKNRPKIQHTASSQTSPAFVLI
jgi:hypothetical protein